MKKKKRLRTECKVYGLYDPETFDLRYIGQTRLGKVSRRLHFHQRNARLAANAGKRLSPVEGWIYALAETGKEPVVRVFNKNATWDVTEILMIADAKARGAKLLNVLRGGGDTYNDLVRETGYKSPPLHQPIDDLEREYRDIMGA